MESAGFINGGTDTKTERDLAKVRATDARAAICGDTAPHILAAPCSREDGHLGRHVNEGGSSWDSASEHGSPESWEESMDWGNDA